MVIGFFFDAFSSFCWSPSSFVIAEVDHATGVFQRKKLFTEAIPAARR